MERTKGLMAMMTVLSGLALSNASNGTLPAPDCAKTMKSVTIQHPGRGLNYTTYTLEMDFNSRENALFYSYDYGRNAKASLELERGVLKYRRTTVDLFHCEKDYENAHWVVQSVRRDLETAQKRVQKLSHAQKSTWLKALACGLEVNQLAADYVAHHCPYPVAPPSSSSDDSGSGIGINPSTGGITIQLAPGLGYDVSNGQIGPSIGF